MFRFASLFKSDDTIAQLGFDSQERKELISCLAEHHLTDDLDPLLDTPFKQKSRSNPTRFSDGTFPVFYSSLDSKTAAAETKHWVPERLGRPSEPRTIYYRQFSVHFDGTEMDLRSKVGEWPKLIHDNDYYFCQQIGAEARQLDLDALVTWSARRNEGTNLPVFSRHAISQPRQEGLVAMTYDPATGEVLVRHQ